MIYTIDELKQKIIPVAVKYNLPAVYLFGSYARGEATEDSDVDILVDKTGTEIKGLFALGGLYEDLNEQFEKNIDLVTLDMIEQPDVINRTPWFVENLKKERVALYER